MSDSDFVTAFAPASIGNVAVGFDMLGLAIAGAGDRVSARLSNEPGVRLIDVRGMDGQAHGGLAAKAEENTASIAARSLWDAHGGDEGLEMIVRKGVPLQSGMGSSAASAVAGAVAANALLCDPLTSAELLQHALEGEKFASGGVHADNVAPSLFGGLVLCPPVLLPTTVGLAIPDGVSSVLVHPELEVNTAESRGSLVAQYSMHDWLTQQGYLAGFIAACEKNDVEILARCLRDELIEPQRAAMVPCFPSVKKAAMQHGALGCSLSGSGPSMFALCRDEDAVNIEGQMVTACRSQGFECQSWISPLDAPGAHIEDA